jgi:transcriptional regulator with XRE-family HTH domain
MSGHASGMSLGEFLRTRRERLTPERVGLPTYGRRRTSGLRREEVAQLAHIGTSWYTLLEQNKNANPSEQVLDSLAQALRLTEEERLHLHRLARPEETSREIRSVTTGLERTILALDPNPAFVLGRSWDLLVWNLAAQLVFRLPAYDAEMRERPNWLKRFLYDPLLRTHDPDWEAKLEVMIARFRADTAKFPNDPGVQALITGLLEEDDRFRTIWRRHSVSAAEDCHKQWNNPDLGQLEFESVTLQVPASPDVQVAIYTAAPQTASRLSALLMSR